MKHVRTITVRKAVYEYSDSVQMLATLGPIITSVLTGLSSLATAKDKATFLNNLFTPDTPTE